MDRPDETDFRSNLQPEEREHDGRTMLTSRTMIPKILSRLLLSRHGLNTFDFPVFGPESVAVRSFLRSFEKKSRTIEKDILRHLRYRPETRGMEPLLPFVGRLAVEVLDDGRASWKGIYVLLTCAVDVTAKCMLTQRCGFPETYRLFRLVASELTDVFDEEPLKTWIEEQGGWNSWTDSEAELGFFARRWNDVRNFFRNAASFSYRKTKERSG